MQTLQDLYLAHQGKVSDKWSLYLAEYDRLFHSYRERPVRLLEIGVQNGGSLDVWSKYFSNAKVLIGCDINPDCAKLRYEDPRVSIVVGDANAEASWQAVADLAGRLDVVIDDGSHVSGDIIESFLRYFPLLTSGGIYVAEDLHCSYWQQFEGGLFDPHSSISFFKALADVVNHEHWGLPQQREYVLTGLAEKYGLNFSAAGLELVHSVEFINSMCVVRKQPAPSNQLGNRVIAGQEVELVVAGLKPLQGGLLVALDQVGTRWSSHASVACQGYPDTCVNLGKELASSQQQLQEVSALLSAAQLKHDAAVREIADVNASAHRLAVELQELRGQHSALSAQLNSLMSSNSWKLTTPLRWPRLQRRRLLAVQHRVADYIRRQGGVMSVLQKIQSICRREGLVGLRQRWQRMQQGQLINPAPGSGGHDRNDYQEWIRRFDTMSDVRREEIRRRIASMPAHPLISVVMPTYNPNPAWLSEAINSVRNQLYPYWELCIADDASTNPAIRVLLEGVAVEDERIKVVFRESNGHISAASNSALTLATGDWIALLDHDDLLPEHALFHVAAAIVEKPSLQMIYSDEDKVDERGHRSAPYFKTDWNPDLFYSHNMFCHLGVYRRALVDRVAGFRLGLEGAQDYDLALRCIELVDEAEIHHIPHVLYHWRIHEESTAGGAEAKPYAMLAGERALNEHFQRQGVKGRVELQETGYRAYYDLPDVLPLVSLIIPTRNGEVLVRQCVESIVEKTLYKHYEIIIIDNGSDDPDALKYFEALSSSGIARVVRDDRPFNYSALNNAAVKIARGDLIGLINNDIEVISPDWLGEMVSHALRPGIGAVGAKLLYPHGAVQHAGVILGIGGVAGHSHKGFPRKHPGYSARAQLISRFSAVTAACLLVKKSVYEQVSGLNEIDLTVAFNDVDFCLRIMRAGYHNVWTPYAELYHHESATRGYEDDPVKQARFAGEVEYMKSTWGELLDRDPYYSSNLTLDYEDFSLRWSLPESDI